MIHIVGAGPGDPELITVKGARYLAEADVVIYAGSLVNPALLDMCKAGTEIHNSAHMTLDEVVETIARAESEGKILDKTQLLMLLITVLSLLSSSLGVSNLISANIMERSRELGLLKALGATNRAVVLSVLAEIFIAGILGGILGYVVGLGFAQLIGENVFGSGIAVNPYVIPIIAVLMSLVLIIGSVPAIRMLLSLQPAEVLYGR